MPPHAVFGWLVRQGGLERGHPVMRSLVAVVALACAGWAQWAALDCPMDLSATGVAPMTVQGEHPAPEHAHHAGAGASDADGSADEEPSSPHSDPSCVLVMVCGSAGQAAPPVSGAVLADASIEAAPAFLADSYRTLYPTPEPPPPRLPV